MQVTYSLPPHGPSARPEAGGWLVYTLLLLILLLAKLPWAAYPQAPTLGSVPSLADASRPGAQASLPRGELPAQLR